MLKIRHAQERGHAQIDWLESFHTFSFSDYYDPRYMAFRHLRVINEDFVKPDRGFGAHPHQDMEIITYILEGQLEHKDSMGNGSVIKPGDVQRMSAGTGVTHSEFNPSKTETVHLLQIWILPNKKGLPPSYEQRSYSKKDLLNQFRLIGSGGQKKDAVAIHQDVDLYASLLDSGQTLDFKLKSTRYAWIQITRGGVQLNQVTLNAGDGAAVSGETELVIKSTAPQSEFLLFNLS